MLGKCRALHGGGAANWHFSGMSHIARSFPCNHSIAKSIKTIMTACNIQAISDHLNNMNNRLLELAETERTVVIQCMYNDPRLTQTCAVHVPYRFYQAHQHLWWRVSVGVNDDQGTYVFCKFARGDVMLHRLVVDWYMGGKACQGYQIHHRDATPTNNILSNLMLVTRRENSSARGPSNSIKTCTGVKGVYMNKRRDRYVCEFQSGDKLTHPKITASFPLNQKEVAIALYNRLSRSFNGDLAYQNVNRQLTPDEQELLQTEYDSAMDRYRKRKTLFDANGGRPKRVKKTT
jgi:hypothetical protein